MRIEATASGNRQRVAEPNAAAYAEQPGVPMASLNASSNSTGQSPISMNPKNNLLQRQPAGCVRAVAFGYREVS